MNISDIFLILLCYFITLVHSQLEIPTCPYDKLTNLDLSDSGLVRIKASFADNSAIKYLNLKNNQISEIDNGAFDDLPELECINLAENNLPREQFNFLHSTTMETLILDNAFLDQMYSTSSTPYTYYNYQHKMNTRFLIRPIYSQKLPNLKKLYLNRNEIGSSDKDNFSNLMKNTPNLTHLYLYENKITASDFLYPLPSTLSHLYLNNNHISQFSSKSLNNLEVLIMDNNTIQSICGDDQYCNNGITLKGASNLKIFSIANVGLNEIEPDAFENQAELQSLDISHNYVHKLTRHTLDNMTNLQIFRLDYNNFTTVPDICKLVKLELLSLGHNNIEEINGSSFCDLFNLKTLNLTSNNLQLLAPETFVNLMNLEELDLSWNKIVFLPENWISPSCILKHLNLAYNLFNDISSLSLSNINALTFLNIDINFMKQIAIKDLWSLPENTTINVDYTDIQKIQTMDSSSMNTKHFCENCYNNCEDFRNSYCPY